MPNPNAERVFLASGLPDTERVRRAIMADARYKMNHIPGIRFSDAVASACHNFPNLASPIALSILNRPEPEPEPRTAPNRTRTTEEPMTNQQKAAKAVHDLAVAGYGDELNAILAFLIEAPIENLSQFSDLVDVEVAANPNLPEG